MVSGVTLRAELINLVDKILLRIIGPLSQINVDLSVNAETFLCDWITTRVDLVWRVAAVIILLLVVGLLRHRHGLFLHKICSFGSKSHRILILLFCLRLRLVFVFLFCVSKQVIIRLRLLLLRVGVIGSWLLIIIVLV